MKRATFAAAGAAMLVSAGRASAQTPAVIRVATGGKESDAQAYYAQELGYFARAGLNVEVQTMQSGSAVAAGVASGSLHIGVASVLVVATAHQRGLPFVYIAPAAQYSSAAPPSVLVVAVSSPLRAAQELNGRTIGVLGLRGIDQITTQAWIDQNGGDSSTVHFAEVIQSEMPPALERGTLDAAQLAEPVLSTARGKVRIFGRPYEGLGKDYLISGWFATSDWVAKNQDSVKKFADVMRQTALWANANPARARTILAKYAKLNDDPAVKRAPVILARTLEPAALAPIINLGVKYKVLTSAIPPGDLIASLAGKP